MKLKHNVIASAILAVSSVPVVQAQIEEVIVTAQHRAESAMEVPLAITAISEESLRNSGLNGPADIGAVTPGLISTESNGSFTPYIRGVGSRANTPGNESPVATYIDNVYQIVPAGVTLSGFSDVRSVEVLRGPQGTLFGRNATGGAVRISTYDPSQEFGGRIELTYGTDKKMISGYATGGLSDTFSLLVSAYDEEKDEYIRNLNPANGLGSHTGGADNRAVRTKLLWEPADDFSAMLTVVHSNFDDYSKTALQIIDGSPLSTAEINGVTPSARGYKRAYAGDTPPSSYFRNNEYSLTLNAGFDLFDLISITSYGESQYGVQLDSDSSPAPILYIASNAGVRAFQQEVRFVSNGDGPFSWLGGLFYYDTVSGYNRGGDLYLPNGMHYPVTLEQLSSLPAGSAAITYMHTEVDIQSHAVFGEVGYELTDATKLTLGLRFTDEKQELDRDNNMERLAANGGGFTRTVTYTRDVCAASPSCSGLDNDFREWTWRAVAEHRFGDDWLGYASYNRGFKSGAFALSAATDTSSTEPELLDAFEIGVKGTAFDRRVQVTSSFYFYDYQDLQQSVTDPVTGAGLIINAAAAETYGFELDVLWSVNDDLTLQFGGNYVFNAEYQDYDNCQVYTSGATGPRMVRSDCSGTQMVVTPDYALYLSANYQAYTFANGSSLQLGAVLDYTDGYNYMAEPKSVSFAPYIPSQDSVENLNAYARWNSADDQYFINLYGSNLTDSDRMMGVSATTRGMSTQYARGREYGVTVGVKF